MSNAIRHSRATHVRVSVHVDAGTVVLMVQDDGVGFDPDVPPPAGHLGLANLRDRAAAVGGVLEIDSHPGAGTRIIVRLPMVNTERLTP